MCGAPDVYMTEFTSTDGMMSKGRDKVEHRLLYTEKEKPLIAQIWGTKPELFYESAKRVASLGFDGIDINMGCPARDITQHGACSRLITNHALAKEIVLATKKGAPNLPISVKTRCGYNSWVTEEWFTFLLSLPLDALTVHGRIAKEMSKFPANWDEIGKVVKLRDEINPHIQIIGNGDIESNEEAMQKAKQYNLDGIMIGRGMFGNLWIFNKDVDPQTVPIKQKLELLITHIQLFEKTWGENKPVEILKKFYKVYVSGMENASEIRMKLMECKDSEETVRYVQELIYNY